jgi:hypothetical protein
VENVWTKQKNKEEKEAMVYITWSLGFFIIHRTILKGRGSNKRAKLAEDLVSMAEMRHEWKILVGEIGGKISLGNITLNWI